MIGYATLGTNDLARATRFYDVLLGELGAKHMMETERFVIWFVTPDRPALGLFKPYDGKAATVGNGTMIALAVDTPAKVDEMHRMALELGATDEGAPGPRAIPGFYAGYFRDLDGNKLNFYCFTT